MISINSTDDVIDKFLNYKRPFLTPSSFDLYNRYLHKFKLFCPDDLTELQPGHIDDYLNAILEYASHRTTNGHLNVIRSFCKWLSKRYQIQNPASVFTSFKEEPPRQRVITEEEYSLLLKAAYGIEKDVIQFVANTGVRRFELHSIHWNMINKDLSLLTIIGKGKKRRVIPLNSTCRKILSQWNRCDDKIPLAKIYSQASNYYLICQRLSKKTGIPPFGLHALRHFYCTRLLLAGVSIYKVSLLMGHSSVKTTEALYSHLAPVDLLGLTECLNF